MPNSSTQVRKQKEKARLHPVSGYGDIIPIRLRASPHAWSQPTEELLSVLNM